MALAVRMGAWAKDQAWKNFMRDPLVKPPPPKPGQAKVTTPEQLRKFAGFLARLNG